MIRGEALADLLNGGKLRLKKQPKRPCPRPQRPFGEEASEDESEAGQLQPGPSKPFGDEGPEVDASACKQSMDQAAASQPKGVVIWTSQPSSSSKLRKVCKPFDHEESEASGSDCGTTASVPSAGNFTLGWEELHRHQTSHAWTSHEQQLSKEQQQRQKRAYHAKTRQLRTDAERSGTNKQACNGASRDRVNFLLKQTCNCTLAQL